MDPNCLLGAERQESVTFMEAPGRPMTVSRTWQEMGDLEVAIVSAIFSEAEVGGVAVCGVE